MRNSYRRCNIRFRCQIVVRCSKPLRIQSSRGPLRPFVAIVVDVELDHVLVRVFIIERGPQAAVFAGFMAAPILPGFDHVSYDRAQEQPVPPTPRLALDDEEWRASHGSEGSVVVRAVR
jgi:hypothetical protein